MPKQKLFQIAHAFEQIFNVRMLDYIRKREQEMLVKFKSYKQLSFWHKEYIAYLRAMRASLGDLDWCSGDCRITQHYK